jgi:hypothetical protein
MADLKKTKNSERNKVSARDLASLLRLRRRMGPEELIRFIQSLSDDKRLPKARGAPRMSRTRQGLLAALYDFRECKGHTTISAFANRLPRIVEIKYSRRTPPVYTSYKSVAALETDLRRGLRDDSKKDRLNMISTLIWWRFNHVNPLWGFYGGPRPHLLIMPKNPSEMIGWIDAAIKLSGVDERILRLQLSPN